MKEVARAIANFLEKQVSRRLLEAGEQRVQPVLIASSKTMLAELWNQLTSGGTHDWHLSVDGVAREVVVVLIEEDPPAANSNVLSSKGTWDYAVSLRNSGRPCLVLASARAWDASQESIVQASEQMWLEAAPLGRSPSGEFWSEWEKTVGTQTGTATTDPALALDLVEVARTSSQSGMRGRDDDRVWAIADKLMHSRSRDELIAASGLIRFDSETPVSTVAKTITTLAASARGDGIESLKTELLAVATGNAALATAVELMFAQIVERAGTGAAFEADWPSALENDGSAQWWLHIDHARLQELLLASGILKPPGKLELIVRDLLNPGASDEVSIVRGAPTLDVVQPQGSAQGISVERMAQGKKATPLPRAADGSFTDAARPISEKPLKYRAQCGRLASRVALVVDIDTFPGKAIVSASAGAFADKPIYKAGVWSQHIETSRPGNHSFTVYVPSSASRVTVTGWLAAPIVVMAPTEPVQLPARRVEGSENIDVDVETPDGNHLVSISIEVLQADSTASPGVLEAWLDYHRGKENATKTIRATEGPMRDVETFYLSQADSWRGRFGGWISQAPEGWDFSEDTQAFGDLKVRESQVEAMRAAAMPPAAVTDTRESLRQAIRALDKPLPEVSLADPNLSALTNAYLRAFLDWLDQKPEDAVWFDVIALFAPEMSQLGSQVGPSPHPAAVLLSPLHPLRVAWLAAAHSLLQEAREYPCPLAGEISAFGAPSCMAVPLGIDPLRHELEWKVFQRAPSNQPWWHLMWSTDKLNLSVRAVVAAQLQHLGLHAQVAVPSMDSAQAKRAIDDVAFLSPSRTAIRVGLTGSSRAGAAADAVLDWIEARFVPGPNGALEGGLNPREADILDLRINPDGPSQERIADLSEQTGGAVRWYDCSARPRARADVLLVEGLGEETTGAIPGMARSAVGPGVLFRIDPTSEGPGKVLIEPRRMERPRVDDGSLTKSVELVSARLEMLAGEKAGADHVERRPPGIMHLFERGKYVALGSGEIDPSLVTTVAHEGNALVWDYELPVPGEPLGSRAGYYLLAGATPAQKSRLDQALALVGADAADPSAVLKEISSRGIPLLRRFSQGGSATRGELGLFLAVRLLQGKPGCNQPAIPAFDAGTVNLLVSVDSYDDYLALVRRSARGLGYLVSERMPDLLLASYTPGDAPKIKLTPVEVKFRGASIEADDELKRHLEQAKSLGTLFTNVFTDLSSKSGLWKSASRAWLGGMLNHAFRIYSAPGMTSAKPLEWAQLHGQCLRDLLDGSTEIEINEAGKLLVFDASTDSYPLDIDWNGVLDTLRVGSSDSKDLVLIDFPRAELNALVRVVFEYGDATQAAGPGGVASPSAPGSSGPAPLPATPVTGEPTATASATQSGSTTRELATTPEAATESAPTDTGAETPPIGSPAPTGATEPSPYNEARARVAGGFKGFIGNGTAIDRVSRDLIVALTSVPRALPKSLLFSGPPSSGKTELCRRIASTLELPFVPLDGTALKSREKLFEMVDGALKQAGALLKQAGSIGGLPVVEYPPFVVFVDEVHLVSRAVQESFLTALESKDRQVNLGVRYARLASATFLFATTKPNGVDPALRSRCEMIGLEPYTAEEVAAMLRLAYEGWPSAVYERLAVLGRRVPRVALRLAGDLKHEIMINGHNDEIGILQDLETIRNERRLDNDGFGPHELAYMRVLQAARGAPVGIDRIANHLVAVPKDSVETEIEPFLLQEGVVELTGRGRLLTRKGAERLAAHDRQNKR